MGDRSGRARCCQCGVVVIRRLGKRRHKVRLHIENGPSIEGILLGRTRAHYVLEASRVLQDSDTSHEAGRVSVPRSRVLFYQVID